MRRSQLLFEEAWHQQQYTWCALMQINTPSGRRSEMAAIYNTSSNTFTPFHIKEHPICAGHTLLPDGRKAIIVGGKCTCKFHSINRLRSYSVLAVTSCLEQAS